MCSILFILNASNDLKRLVLDLSVKDIVYYQIQDDLPSDKAVQFMQISLHGVDYASRKKYIFFEDIFNNYEINKYTYYKSIN